MNVKNFFRKIGQGIKRAFFALLSRIKPRPTYQWFLSFIFWLAVLIYVSGGVFFGFKVYKEHSEDKNTKRFVKIYPFFVSTVNGGVIWAEDYYQQLSYIRKFSEKTQQPFPDQKSLRKQIIDQLIENKLLEMQAVKYHVRVTTKEVNDAYQKIVDQSGGNSEVKKVLTELYGMTEKDFKVLVRQQVLKEKIQNEVIAQVKVSHILVKDENRAKEVAEKAKKGEDFAALAKQFSEDSKSKDNGGELGWLAKGQLVVDNSSLPEFDEAAFKAKKGEITGPVKTSIGYEIIKVTDKKGQVAESYSSWMTGITKQAKIYRLIK